MFPYVLQGVPKKIPVASESNDALCITQCVIGIIIFARMMLSIIFFCLRFPLYVTSEASYLTDVIRLAEMK